MYVLIGFNSLLLHHFGYYITKQNRRVCTTVEPRYSERQYNEFLNSTIFVKRKTKPIDQRIEADILYDIP